MDRLWRFDDRPDAGQRAAQARGHHVYLDGLHGTRVLPDGPQEPWREVARYCLQPQRQHAGGRRWLRDGVGCRRRGRRHDRLRGLQDRQRQVDHLGLPVGRGRAAGRGAAGHRRSDRRRAARPAGRLRGTRRHVRGPQADGCAAARRPREGQRRAGRPLCRALPAAQVLLYPGLRT